MVDDQRNQGDGTLATMAGGDAPAMVKMTIRGFSSKTTISNTTMAMASGGNGHAGESVCR